MSLERTEKIITMSILSYLGLVFSIPIIITVIWGGETNAEKYTVLEIPQGTIKGKVLKSREGKTFHGFMGIPFAQVPERFEIAGLPLPTWEDTYDATNYKEKCLQFNITTLKSEGDEDCLYINVFTPDTLGEMSVLAFIHGGGFQFGLAYENGPEFIMDHNVVFVTFTYRLAALGFLSTGDDILPGNLGLKDQNMALKWIQENIEFFGGDKSKVTLFGESAGAASVSFHIVSPLSAGLFRHAICNSGSSLDRWAITEDPKPVGEKLAEKLDCPTSSSQEIIDCLKGKSGIEITNVQLESHPAATTLAYGPVLETRETPTSFLTNHPRNHYEQGQFSKVPLLTTVNDLEGLLLNALAVLANPELVKAFNDDWANTAPFAFSINKPYYSEEAIKYAAKLLRDFYFGSTLVGRDSLMNLTNIFSDSNFLHRTRRTALLHAKYAPVYTSVLAFKGIWSQTFFMGFKEILGMTHADDLSYVFTDHKYPPFPPGSESEEFSKLLVRMWVNFANTGDPDYELDGEKWLPIQPKEMETEVLNWLHFKNQPQFLPDALKERMSLWDHIDKILETGIIPGRDEL